MRTKIHSPKLNFKEKYYVVLFFIVLFSFVNEGSQVFAQTDPVAVSDDLGSIFEDTDLNFTFADLTLNDDDPVEGNPIFIYSINGVTIIPAGFPQTIPVTNGTLYIVNPNDVTFTPDANFFGTVRFPYVIRDGDNPPRDDTAFVEITVDPVNDLPVAQDDVFPDVLVTGGPFTIPVLDNDDFGGDGPSVGTIVISAPIIPATQGTASVNNNGTPNDPTDDTITFRPVSNYVGPISIFYTISDRNIPFPSNTSSAEITTNVLGVSDLSIAKVVNTAPPYNVGDIVEFELTVTNNGPSDATNIRVVDKLPDGFTFDGTDDPILYDEVSGEWLIPSLSAVAPNNTSSLIITGRINPTGSYRNIAEITAANETDPDSVPGNNTPSEDDQDEVTLTVTPAVDLVTTKVVDNPTPNEGDIVTYTITVRNDGPSDATNVDVRDVLPAGVTYISNSLGTDYNPGTGYWDIGKLINGGQASLNITASVDVGTGGSLITNEILIGDITSTETTINPDTNSIGDDLTADINVTSTELVTSKTVDNPNPLEGETIVYTIEVLNSLGSSDATNVSLTDLLPLGVTYVSHTQTQGNYNSGSGLWNIGDIINGATETLEITVTVDQGTAGPTPIINTTTAAEGDQSDPDALADTLSAPITVSDEVDIVLTKTVDNPTPNAGDTVTYTVTVLNNGTSNATNVVVTDNLPPGLTFGTVTGQGIWTAPQWIIGNLDAGEQKSITIEAIIDPNIAVVTPNALTNTVVNTQDQTDNNATPDDDTEDIFVTNTELVTIKSVDNATPIEGETIVYTIDVQNNGPSDATNVELTDLLPVGVTYVSHTETQGNYNNGSGLWNIGDIADGAIASLDITVTVNQGTAGPTPIVNTTTAAVGDQLDTDAIGGDILSVPITVSDAVDIVLTKTVDNPTPNAGDTVTYTVTVLNNGTSFATNVEIEDFLPIGLEFGAVYPGHGTWTAPIWQVGDLAPGEEQSIIIEAIIDPNIAVVTPNFLRNTIVNTQDQTDNNATLDDDFEDIFVTSADLVTIKSVLNADPSTTGFSEGDTVIYTIEVENAGPSDATNVSLTDQLPIGVTYVSDNSGGTYDRVTGVWNIGNIANGNTAILNITATIDVGTQGQPITNTTTAAVGDQSQPIPSTTVDILTASFTVLDEADIVLTKVVDNPTPNAGDTVIFTVTARNNGSALVTNLEVTDVLPAGLQFGGVTLSNGTWTAPTWFIGDLAVGAIETINIEVIVDPNITIVAPNSITNTIFNTQDQVDNNVTLDDLDESITVTSSDLAITKTVDNSTPNEGDQVTYEVVVENFGPSEATNVIVNDLLPVGVTYVSSSVSQGTYNNGSGEWSIGNILNTDTATLTVIASVDNGTVGNTITNTASITNADQSDPDSSNNSDSVSITPITEIDLSVSKTVLNNSVAPVVGATITFEIVVSNSGPNRATGVEVTDFLPSGYRYLNHSSTKGQYNANSGLWDLGEIEINDSEILLIDAIVLNGGVYNNCASVNNYNETDTDLTNNQDCASISPLPVTADPVILEVNKTVIGGNLSPQVGSQISFEIRLTNLDPIITGTSVVVTDLLPSGYTFLTYSSTKGAYDASSGEWVVGTIVAGDTEVLIVDVLVNPSGPYQNCADITFADQPLVPVPAASCITTTPISVIDLELTKEVALSSGSPAPISTSGVLQPFAETNVDFTITITNNGPSEATGVEVLDVLPNGYEFDNASTTIGTYDAVSGIWNVGNIAAGGSETLIITANVNPVGNWLNIAEVVAAIELDIDSTPNNAVLSEDDMDQIATNPIVELNIPEGFTPNGDNINDVFEIEYLHILYPNFSMKIVNRYGNKIYEYTHNGDPFQTPLWWDGFSSGNLNLSNQELPTGTYFYVIYFNNNERKPQTGWVYLRR